MASERLFLLESEDDMGAFVQFARILARGDIPPLALEVIRRGRLVHDRSTDCTLPAYIEDPGGVRVRFPHTQTLLDLDPRATVLSVDGIGAFDLISRNAMMAGVTHVEEGDKLLPFVRLFYNSPSTFLWVDDAGTTHHVRQGEG